MRSFGWFTVFALLAVPGSASAYCFTSTCKGLDVCDSVEIPDCTPIRWSSNCVGFVVNDASKAGLSAAEIESVANRAFARWRASDCGDGAPPGLHVEYMGMVACDVAEYNRDAGNANIITLTDNPSNSITGHTFALTTTSFDPNSGELLTADIELNVRDHVFSVGDANVEVDLEAVLTHEVGHFLGLGHSDAIDASMYPFYEPGTTEIRSLSKDDETGICVLYPPNREIDSTCNPLPRHGFSPECRSDQTEGGCATTAAPENKLGAVLASGLALLAGVRKRRKGARRPKERSAPPSA